MRYAAWMPKPIVNFRMLTIDGVPQYLIVVSDWLDGAKSAVRYGHTMYVSPAMWDLLIWAETEAEMRDVWDAIPKDVVPGVKAAWESPGWVNGLPEIEDVEAATAARAKGVHS